MLMLSVVLCALAAAPTTAPTAPTTTTPTTTPTTTTTPPTTPTTTTTRERVLVLDFRNDGAREDLVRVVRDSLVVHLARMSQLEVLSSEDLRRVADLEAQKQALGCTESSCLAELAGAVGARLVVFGNVAQLGAMTQINLSLLDVSTTEMRARESIELQQLEEVPRSVRAAADRMFGVAAVAAPVVEERSLGALQLLGITVVVVGVVVGVGGGALALVADGEAGLGSGLDLKGRRDAQDRVPLLAGVAVGGAALALLGAGLFTAGALTESP